MSDASSPPGAFPGLFDDLDESAEPEREVAGTGLNPAQLDAVVHGDGPLLVVAGAGSGKTRVLTHRIAHLIGQHGVSPFEILAITFTNKAAGEMRERVARGVGPVAEKMWVSTFHSACVRILRRDAEAIGYPKRFSIYDQMAWSTSSPGGWSRAQPRTAPGSIRHCGPGPPPARLVG